MLRIVFMPIAMLAGGFLIVVGLLVCATILGAPIGLGVIALGARLWFA